MDDPAYSVLKKKLDKIKRSNVDPAWLGEKLLEADIIEESDVEKVNAQEGEDGQLGKLTEKVMRNGAPDVFQVLVDIISSKPTTKWLGKELKGIYIHFVILSFCFTFIYFVIYLLLWKYNYVCLQPIRINAAALCAQIIIIIIIIIIYKPVAVR